MLAIQDVVFGLREGMVVQEKYWLKDLRKYHFPFTVVYGKYHLFPVVLNSATQLSMVITLLVTLQK